MLGENKSHKNDIKDTNTSLAQYETNGLSFLSYNKTSKLITALYMITDIMDKEEPLRNKLRNLGANIISDIYLLKGQNNFSEKINDRISEMFSFLEIASNIGLVSEMNYSILSKEFFELKKAIGNFVYQNDQKWLEEFIKENPNQTDQYGNSNTDKTFKVNSPKGQTRVGVQRADTLLRALSDRIPSLNNNDFKNKRREEIISIIKDKAKDSPNFDGVTITDIKSIGQGELASCGEKTLQRELVSMVSDGILVKRGEKRWSRYLIKN